MFKKEVLPLSDVLNRALRQEGLETPMLQYRLIDSWESVVGKTAARYTGEKYIRNQVLFVKILNPALRSDLNMMRTDIVNRLNQIVGSRIIIDIRIY
jgi:predicted nucleic acid-binding Zn ribbon protein